MRIQNVEFKDNCNVLIYEDTIYFVSNNLVSAYKLGYEFTKKRMNLNLKNNIKEIYFFEIKDQHNDNIIKYISDSIKNKYKVVNYNRRRIDSCNLIVD